MRKAGNIYDPSCSARDALELIASKWTTLILPALTQGPMRNAALLRKVGGISQKNADADAARSGAQRACDSPGHGHLAAPCRISAESPGRFSWSGIEGARPLGRTSLYPAGCRARGIRSGSNPRVGDSFAVIDLTQTRDVTRGLMWPGNAGTVAQTARRSGLEKAPAYSVAPPQDRTGRGQIRRGDLLSSRDPCTSPCTVVVRLSHLSPAW
jgi:hypothetical protein